MDRITMTPSELKRLRVMALVDAGQLTLTQASTLLGVSLRHAKRMRARIRRDGPAGICHGNRGRSSPRRLPAALQRQIQRLATTTYADCNDTHCAQLLAARDGLTVSRETVRRLRRAAGHGPKRRHRPRLHRQRRERRPCRGLMMLWDGSPHEWLTLTPGRLCLLAAQDDATGEILAGRFEPTETSLGYLRLLFEVVTTHGIPLSTYQDKHSALQRNDDHWTLAEELAGQQTPTQVGEALQALAIQPITADSPQAKGRIERLNGVVQDRWVPEMRLAGIRTLEAANQWIRDIGIPEHNRLFAKVPKEAQDAFRSARGLDLDRLLSFHYTATVGQDNTVRLHGHVFDIPPGPRGRSYAQARVEVRHLLDGRWRVYHEDHLIATALATGDPTPGPRRAARAAPRRRAATTTQPPQGHLVHPRLRRLRG